MFNYYLANTQKAKSVLLGAPLLQQELLHLSLTNHKPFSSTNNKIINLNQKPILFQTKQEIDKFIYSNVNFWQFTISIFARPCPLRPRHGFVESSIINSHAKLSNLFDRLKSCDPNGELILLPFNDAASNAVLVSSGLLSIGKGNDGATGGHSSISIPVAPFKLSDKILSASGLSNEDTAYIEAVYSDGNSNVLPFQITQIRGGPALIQKNDYIPSKIKIKDIVYPHNDLLQWEKQCKTFDKNTVVYARGHTLASHAAIHCILNKIAFITTEKNIKVGDVLLPENEQEVIINKYKFIVGVMVALNIRFDLKVMLHLSASILHNWAYLQYSPEASWLLGVACCYMCQVLLSLCYGEFRHSRNNNLFKLYNRDSIYEKIITDQYFLKYIKKAPSVAEGFVNKKNFPNSGYGGLKWARATKMAINIWNHIVMIQSSKNEILKQSSIKKIVQVLNKATNLVHNGGWLFDKFSSEDKLSKISKNPGLALFELAHYLYVLHRVTESASFYYTTSDLTSKKDIFSSLRKCQTMLNHKTPYFKYINKLPAVSLSK